LESALRTLERATNSTNKKQGKDEKQILIAQRARRRSWRVHRGHRRAASGNTHCYPVKCKLVNLYSVLITNFKKPI
jgi:hypothetical protein